MFIVQFKGAFLKSFIYLTIALYRQIMVIIISNDVLNDLSMEMRKRTVASICAKVVPLMFFDDINF